MEYGAPILPDLLRTFVDSVSECDITVSIAMLNPDWEFLEHFRPDWPSEVRKSYDKLSALAALYREQQRTLKKRKVSIVVRRYEYVPNWHGLVLNDSQFYIGVCSWKEDVPGSSKKSPRWGRKSLCRPLPQKGGFESWLATAFLGWFDFAFNWSGNACTKKQVVAQESILRGRARGVPLRRSRISP